ncbi:NAD-dependent epimerase/dehydratase family protein [Colwellia demingiae]|uniref:NAD-dependent epimerase/dehydratase family protein n=1 Tax=Colwellia demingiae TaxID=89401 RepID=A0A5C6QRM5_9GAMM|nr:NAD-dependent epimerase/dehydratase family protein [Colwellia demingiae]TWX71916.1 NAD-dependent epimerase/dehydratase family protein [Colwellia demingiae]
MKVLVTGSSGFIGSILTQQLEHKHSVIRHGKQDITESVSNSFSVNINSNSNWGQCLQDVNAIVHLAAVAHNKSNDPDYINEVNVKGTINLAQQAVNAGVKRFVFISSIGVLGNGTTNARPYDEHSNVSPHSEYAQSKLDAERALLKIAAETDLEVIIIRPVLVYGKGAPGNFDKLVNLVSKVPMLPFALCDNKRNFISVDNLADFISVCIEHPNATNEIFCISDGGDISIKEFTNEIAKGLNTPLLQFPVPNFIFNLIGKITGRQAQMDQLIGDLQVNPNKAKVLLDWTPPFTMADTLSRLTR